MKSEITILRELHECKTSQALKEKWLELFDSGDEKLLITVFETTVASDKDPRHPINRFLSSLSKLEYEEQLNKLSPNAWFQICNLPSWTRPGHLIKVAFRLFLAQPQSFGIILKKFNVHQFEETLKLESFGTILKKINLNPFEESLKLSSRCSLLRFILKQEGDFLNCQEVIDGLSLDFLLSNYSDMGYYVCRNNNLSPSQSKIILDELNFSAAFSHMKSKEKVTRVVKCFKDSVTELLDNATLPECLVLMDRIEKSPIPLSKRLEVLLNLHNKFFQTSAVPSESISYERLNSSRVNGYRFITTPSFAPGVDDRHLQFIIDTLTTNSSGYNSAWEEMNRAQTTILSKGYQESIKARKFLETAILLDCHQAIEANLQVLMRIMAAESKNENKDSLESHTSIDKNYPHLDWLLGNLGLNLTTDNLDRIISDLNECLIEVRASGIFHIQARPLENNLVKRGFLNLIERSHKLKKLEWNKLCLTLNDFYKLKEPDEIKFLHKVLVFKFNFEMAIASDKISLAYALIAEILKLEVQDFTHHYLLPYYFSSLQHPLNIIKSELKIVRIKMDELRLLEGGPAVPLEAKHDHKKPDQELINTEQPLLHPSKRELDLKQIELHFGGEVERLNRSLSSGEESSRQSIALMNLLASIKNDWGQKNLIDIVKYWMQSELKPDGDEIKTVRLFQPKKESIKIIFIKSILSYEDKRVLQKELLDWVIKADFINQKIRALCKDTHKSPGEILNLIKVTVLSEENLTTDQDLIDLYAILSRLEVENSQKLVDACFDFEKLLTTRLTVPICTPG